MAGGMDWLETKKCKACGKKFAVLYPHLWRYKRTYGTHNDYFCSWGCLRRYDRKGTDDVKKNDQMEIARELAEAMERGEDPKEFLKSKGYTNPNKAYTNIKAKCMENDPELAERIPNRRAKKAEVVTAEKLPEAEQGCSGMFQGTKGETAAKRSFAEMKKPDDARILGQEPLEVASVYSRVIDGAIYKKAEGGRMYLMLPPPILEMTAYEWFKLTEEILVALRQLDVCNPSRTREPEEYTGNNGPLK